MKEKFKNWTKWMYWFLFAVAVITVYKTLDNFNDILSFIDRLFDILTPFLAGLLIAYILYIPARKLEVLYQKIKVPKKISRPLGVFSVYIIVLLLIVLIINVVLPALSESILELTGHFPSYYESIMKNINDIPDDFFISRESILEAAEKIKNFDYASYLSAERIMEYLKGVMNVAHGIFNIFVTIIMSIYILLQRADILKFIRKFSNAMFKEGTYNKLSRYFKSSNEIFFKFLSSQIIDAIVVGIITSIAMSIMGVKYAILLGFIIGLFNIIPYFGAIVAVGIAIIITIFTGGLVQAIWMAVVIIILQQIDANIINPKIVGDSLQLSPILVIFAVTVGGAYFNFIGMFLAVPVIAILKLMLNDYIDYRNEKKKLQQCIEQKEEVK